MTATPGLPVVQDASPELLRAAFRKHAAGVAVVTAPALPGAGPAGFTATSLTSVSAEPPMVSFGVGTGSTSWPAMRESAYVGVHVLEAGQEALAVTFSTSGIDRFAAPTRWFEGPHGVPLLEGVQAWMVCRVRERMPAGDHRLFLAEVVAGEASGPGGPLLYHGGRFGRLAPHSA